MKQITFKIEGTTALMQNSPKTVNPFDSFTKAIAAITAKRKRTDEDTLELFRLKWMASLYYEDGKYIIPASHFHQAIVAAGKEKKLGSKFTRSFGIMTPSCPLKFKDSKLTPEELYKHSEYVDIRAVGIRGSKVPQARFIVPKWSTEVSCWYDESQLNEEEIIEAFNIAGLRYGIGTFRALYGRFSADKI